jgi:hypothetical protein
LATTSAGLAWTLGRADTQVSRDQVLHRLRLIAGAVTVPVNADFEGGYAVDPADVAANVKMAADTGIAGLSIEDSSGDEAHPLFEFDLAVERVAAARRGIDESGTGIVLTGRYTATSHAEGNRHDQSNLRRHRPRRAASPPTPRETLSPSAASTTSAPSATFSTTRRPVSPLTLTTTVATAADAEQRGHPFCRIADRA